MANPNIVNVQSIYGTTASLSVPATLSALVTNAAASSTVIKVDTIMVSNNDTSGHTVTVSLVRTVTQAGTYPISTNVSVPVGAVYDVLSKFVYLMEGDSIQVSADTASKCTAVASYEVIS